MNLKSQSQIHYDATVLQPNSPSTHKLPLSIAWFPTDLSQI